MAETTVSHLICEALIAAGIDTLYCLPGVQNDDFFDVLLDFGGAIRPVVARHEQGAAYMATGAALATGRPQAYCVVPGEGVLNAAAAHATAWSVHAPVLALHGQIATRALGKGHGLLHEVPAQGATVGAISKHMAELRTEEEAPDQVADALSALLHGAPRPVTIEVPMDLWSQPVRFMPGDLLRRGEGPMLDRSRLADAAAALVGAEAPLMILGGGAHGSAGPIQALAERLSLPVTAQKQGKGALDARHPLFVPYPVGHRLWTEADVVLAVGSRLQVPEMAWGTEGDLTLIAINADGKELNRRGRTTIPLHAMAEEALPALLEAVQEALADRAPPDRRERLAALRTAHAAEIAGLEPSLGHLGVIREVLGEDGIFVEDLTQVAFTGRFAYPTYKPRTYLCSGHAGTLGWGYPAALGAALAAPGRRVLSVQGDGGFLYCANELATAVKYAVPLVALVYNDNAFGNVKRIQQTRFGANRTIAADLSNPDFVAFAESFGALGLRTDGTTDGLHQALETAFDSGRPAVVEVPVAEIYPSPWPFIQLTGGRGGGPFLV
ncbi:MAG: thiamine pyrophosphate-dependent enzyme [Pseudomonadota bacterium]